MSDNAPNRLPLPPLLLVGCVGLGYILHHVLPLGWEPDQVGQIMRGTGWVLIGLAIALDIWAIRTLGRHKTTVMPHKAASQLAVDGPFAHSRNPIYLGNVLICLGLGFVMGSRWLVLMAAVLFMLLSRLAVAREEKHLAEKFPEEWKAYSGKVRRWI